MKQLSVDWPKVEMFGTDDDDEASSGTAQILASLRDRITTPSIMMNMMT